MILEAFSRELQQTKHQRRMPQDVLSDWLAAILLEPAAPGNHIAQVIHAEIALLDPDELGLLECLAPERDENLNVFRDATVQSAQVIGLDQSKFNPEQDMLDGAILLSEGGFLFEGRTKQGRQLLNSLLKFCKSYDHWQFCRWLHQVNASDFCRLSEF